MFLCKQVACLRTSCVRRMRSASTVRCQTHRNTLILKAFIWIRLHVYRYIPTLRLFFLLILPINSQTHIRITNLHSHLTIYICNQKLVRDHLFSALINKINTRTDRDVTEHIMTDIMFALDYISWKHITDNRGNSVNITLMPFNKRYMLRQHSLVRRVYLSWAQCKLLLK